MHGADRFRTLVSMATDSSHRVIMGNVVFNPYLDNNLSEIIQSLTIGTQ